MIIWRIYFTLQLVWYKTKLIWECGMFYIMVFNCSCSFVFLLAASWAAASQDVHSQTFPIGAVLVKCFFDIFPPFINSLRGFGPLWPILPTLTPLPLSVLSRYHAAPALRSHSRSHSRSHAAPALTPLPLLSTQVKRQSFPVPTLNFPFSKKPAASHFRGT